MSVKYKIKETEIWLPEWSMNYFIGDPHELSTDEVNLLKEWKRDNFIEKVYPLECSDGRFIREFRWTNVVSNEGGITVKCKCFLVEHFLAVDIFGVVQARSLHKDKLEMLFRDSMSKGLISIIKLSDL